PETAAAGRSHTPRRRTEPPTKPSAGALGSSEAVALRAGIELGDAPRHEIEIRGRVERLVVRTFSRARDLPVLERGGRKKRARVAAEGEPRSLVLRSNGWTWALGGCGRRRRPRNAPHGIADVVGDEQRARFVECNPDRAAQCFAVFVYKTGENIDRLSRRAASGGRHEKHFVAAQGFAVPRSMLSDKSTAAIRLRKQASDVESQPERS